MITIRRMVIDDYDKICHLWHQIQGFAIRSIDDSRQGIETFLRRNPNTSVVAEYNGEIIGTILCGNDGRYGYLYHVCVMKDYRAMGIGKLMVQEVIKSLREENISKIALIAFSKNEVGNTFWKKLGWTRREDVNYYDFTLNEDNIIAINE